MKFNDVFYNFLECDDDELEEYITIDKYNSCPCCNVVNSPTIKGLIEYPIYETKLVDMNEGKINVFSEGTYKAELIEREVLVGKKTDIVYQCSSSKCQRIFIVHYQTEKEYGEIKNTIIDTISPFSTADVSVSENINEICERYYEIYRQAYLAEMMGLTEICGMGYRKALEFLVKDYVIYLNSDNEKLRILRNY